MVAHPRSTMASDSLFTPREILNRFYAAERQYMSSPSGAADFSILAPTLSTSVILTQSPDLPYGGDFHGHTGFLQWSEAMQSLFSKVDVQDPEILEGEDKCVVLSTVMFKVRRTGEEFQRPLVQIVGVDREEGTITSMRPVYWDVKGFNEILNRAL